MGPISVTGHLLGTVAFTRDGRAVALPPSSAALLAFLLLRHGRSVERSRLADVLAEAGDISEGMARRRVNTAIWRLRRLLEADGVPRESVLSTVGTALAVSPTCAVWVDAVEFESACHTLSRFERWTDADARRIADAVALYRGDFLDGRLYTDWALAERSRLADLHLTALVRLAQWFQRHGNPEQALVHARTAVAAEPLREDLHRLVMQLYADAGLPQLAARQLQHCRTVLADQLGVEPLPETVAVARVAAAPSPPGPDHYDRAIRELERSHEELCRMEARLGRSLRALRRERDAARGTVTGR